MLEVLTVGLDGHAGGTYCRSGWPCWQYLLSKAWTAMLEVLTVGLDDHAGGTYCRSGRPCWGYLL